MKQPSQIPLVLIVIITSLLALPANSFAVAIYWQNDRAPLFAGLNGNRLIVVSLVGVALLVGYCATMFFKRYSLVFWLCSFLYNFGLGAIYTYLVMKNVYFCYIEPDVASLCETSDFVMAVFSFLSVFWIWFVALASLYYAECARRLKKYRPL